MEHQPFPPFIGELPRATLSFAGLKGWIVKGDRWQVIFMEADETTTIPMHHHGEQWGIVLEGTMKLLIHNESQYYERGDTHYIPSGVDHEATLYAGWKGLYVFAHDSRPVAAGAASMKAPLPEFPKDSDIRR